MKLTFRPIDRWDHPDTDERRRSPFDASYSDTIDLLSRELRLVGADSAVLMVDCTERECRLDGQLRADARPSSPRVIIAFESEYGPLKYHCDRFSYWHANLRAVALGLEALRRVERYGITKRGEQYLGWKQLPAGIAMGEPMTKPEAARVLVDLADPDFVTGTRPLDLLSDAEVVEEMWRIAARQHHPDRGGDADLFARAQAAHDVLAGSNA